MSLPEMKRRIENGHVFQENWENMYIYLFSVVRDEIVCLNYNKEVSMPKENNLLRHRETIHKEKFGHLVGKPREDEFIVLKYDLERYTNIFTVANKSSEAAVFMQLHHRLLQNDRNRSVY
jgi:hypothetical protein